MTTTKPARVCANCAPMPWSCARVRVAGKTTNHYVCAVTDRVVGHGDTWSKGIGPCECWKKKRDA